MTSSATSPAGWAEPCPLLEGILREALAAVEGRALVRGYFSHAACHAGHVIAIGKAASSMLQGLLDVMPQACALLITKDGHVGPQLLGREGIEIIEAGQPLPDARSLYAGRRLLEFIATAPLDRPLLFLLSGGVSSLVEVLPEGVTLADWRRVNAWLLGHGLDIHAMNVVRKRLSCIKGGRLLGHLGGRRARVLMISDVPGDEPASIGSGLLAPYVDVPLPELPEWIRDLLEAAPPPPAPDDPRWASVEARILAGQASALEAAARAASSLGLPVHRHAEPLCNDAAQAGARLACQLMDGPPGLHLWGGETTVNLPARPGRGGRNQHLALSAALRLAGQAGITLLAAATDGTDGPTADAGACVDGTTAATIRAAGMDPEDALRLADSGTALAAADALIRTGPTGTNVMDMVLALKSAD